MKTMKLAVLVVVLTVAMGWWLAEARGDGTNRPAAAGPIPRFTIQADTNCVVDNLTGLMWARNANLPGATQSWAQAISFCKNLNYGGHSDWRLPNMNELRGLMNRNYTRPALSNTAGTAKWEEGDPFKGVKEYDKGKSYYWVTTTSGGEPGGAWLVTFFNGDISRDNANETTGAGYVWPVRDVKPTCAPTRDTSWFNFFSKPCLVKDGKPRADIVIAARQTPRAVKLAALELQTYIAKISGAQLPITTAPGTNVDAHIFVGRSEYTDTLKIEDDGLQGGAFRMVSGKDYLVLLGHDKDFTMPQYASRNNSGEPPVLNWDERTLEHWGNQGLIQEARKAWDQRTGEKWSDPGVTNWWCYSPAVGLWDHDQRGTLNAVYEFLRGLGVRWYMPGELGEIVPELKTISLAPVDKTVKPAFPYRNLRFYAPSFGGDGARDGMLYKLRIGVDATLDIPGPHGICNVVGRKEVMKAHPEFYANQQTPASPDGFFVSCLSSPELVAETVKYARAVFDIYPDLKYLSIMPNDGYWSGNMCQCDLCKGKLTPERGGLGKMSDYVCDFTERVARELYKTHPDRTVISNAYGEYMMPPAKIAKFSPNVMIGIVMPSDYFTDPERHSQCLDIRKGWLTKLAPGNVYVYRYYLTSDPTYGKRGLPSYLPHKIAADLHALKGLTQGEYIELAWDVSRFEHLNAYVTSRCYWDVDLDIEALLNEYYEKFYGPAAKEMKAFIEYSEENWSCMDKEAAPVARALDLLAVARKAAGDTVYGKRIELVEDYCLVPMTQVRDRLDRARDKNLPAVSIFEWWNYGNGYKKSDIKIDGKFDDKLWKGAYWGSQGNLGEVETGRSPYTMSTSFTVGWADNALYLAIHCEECDTKGLKLGTAKNDDMALYDGDFVELLLETQAHSYYRIAIAPNGAMVDADMANGTPDLRWSSKAEVATYVGDGFWNVEARIPMEWDAANKAADPLSGVVGNKPIAPCAFSFNLCRQRVRDRGTERSAFSPTGKPGFYEPAKFGTLTVTQQN